MGNHTKQYASPLEFLHLEYPSISPMGSGAITFTPPLEFSRNGEICENFVVGVVFTSHLEDTSLLATKPGCDLGGD